MFIYTDYNTKKNYPIWMRANDLILYLKCHISSLININIQNIYDLISFLIVLQYFSMNFFQ
jgi:hypothetical protein